MEKKLKVFLEQMKDSKRMPGKNQLLLLLLIGILLVVIAIPVSDNSSDDQSQETETVAAAESFSAEEYTEYMEQKVSEALSQVDGVGRNEVMITLKSSATKVVEKDENSSSQTTEEEDSEGGTRETADSATDESSVYEQDSSGNSTPYISKELTPEVEGVLVIAEGGDNAVVVRNITEAIQALFGVEAHKIKIMKRTDT